MDMQSHLEIHNSIRGYCVSALIKLDFYGHKLVLDNKARKGFGLHCFFRRERGVLAPNKSIRNRNYPLVQFPARL